MAPSRPFTPARDRFARMLVQRQFQLVSTLDAVDPVVRKLWFKRYPRGDIAIGNEAFALGDTDDGKGFRFILAGHTADCWFILFETGGLIHHHTLLFFDHVGSRFRVVEAAWGNLHRNTFESCVRAVSKGDFVLADDLGHY